MTNKLAGYYDYAAATPLDEAVLAVMTPYFTGKFYNPSALYQSARRVKADIKQARELVASCLGARAPEIIFVSDVSEANNLAIKGVMDQYDGANMIISALEHSSVIQAAGNYNVKVCPVTASGITDLDALSQLIDDQTVLISIMMASNEIGTIQPLRKISELVAKVRVNRHNSGNKLPLYLHTDAAQGVNYLDIHTSRLGVDLLSLGGGKIYGPRDCGVLFVKAGVVLKPLISGGHQEYGVRSGTENTPGIIGLAKAMELAERRRGGEVKRLTDLRTELAEGLAGLGAEYQINGSLKARLPNNLNVTFFGQDNERLMILLDNAGFLVATGSACNASDQEASAVLMALGLSEADARSSLRFSMGRYTTDADVNALLSALKTILA